MKLLKQILIIFLLSISLTKSTKSKFSPNMLQEALSSAVNTKTRESKQSESPKGQEELNEQTNPAMYEVIFSKDNQRGRNQIYKVLFSAGDPEESKPSRKTISQFNYKNLSLNKIEISIYRSKSPGTQEPTTPFSSEDYLYTINLNQLALPCLGRLYVCLFSQFMLEYPVIFPNLDYSVPKEIERYFSQGASIGRNCIVLLSKPIERLSEATFVCHDNHKVVLQLQEDISNRVRQSYETQDSIVYADYITEDYSSRTKVVLDLYSDQLTVTKLNKQSLMKLRYSDIQYSAYSLFSRDSFKWKGEKPGPDSDRCFKLILNKANQVAKTLIFCIYSTQSTLMLDILTKQQAIWHCIYTVEVLNRKLSRSLYLSSLGEGIEAFKRKGFHIDTKTIDPVKQILREKFLIERHNCIRLFRSGVLTKQQMEALLCSLRESTVGTVCNGIELCVRAMFFSIDKGSLPLSGTREKVAMDSQNPFLSRMPERVLSLRDVPIAEDRLDKGLEYWRKGDGVEGLDLGSTSIRRAFNTMALLRDQGRVFESIEAARENCASDLRYSNRRFKRKLALMTAIGVNDPFFRFLGDMTDEVRTMN